MIGLLINLLIIVLIFALVWWVITQLPLPPPFAKIAQVVVVVLACLVVIDLLAGLAGTGLAWRPMWR